MSPSVCPIAVIQAPAKVVWDLISDPATYTGWSDATVDRVLPEGPARAGQQVEAHTRLLGLKLPVNIEVRGVDPAQRTLDLTTALPFGITVLNHITVTPEDAGTCRVSFG
jgi:hypothetical protein